MLVGFGNLHFHLFLCVGRFGHLDDRLKLQLLVFHLHGHHAIETDRHIVGDVVRLYQGHIDVDIRNHLFGSGDLHLTLLAEVLHQHVLQHLVVGFHGHQCLGFFVGREGDDDLLAHLIAFGRSLHGELCGSARGRRGMAIAPVEADDLGEGVAPLLVVDDEEVAAPFVVRDVEGHRGGAIAGQGAVLHRGFIGTRGIALQRVLVLARPPPVGIQLIEGIVEGDGSLAGRAVLVDHGDIEGPVFLGVVVAAIFRGGLRQVDAHITLVWRELRLEGSDAEVATLFEDLHREGAVHHLGGIDILQRTEAHIGHAFRVEVAAIEGQLLRDKALGLVHEGVVGIRLESGLTTTELHIHFGLQSIGFHAVEPS